MIYNEDYKKEYLNTLNLKKASEERYLNLFNNSGVQEHALKKDLFDMSFDELELVFYKLQSSKSRTLISYITLIKNYIGWAKDVKKYSDSPTHPIVDRIGSSFVEKYLYKEALVHYTRAELLEAIEGLINVQDKAIILSAFEGIRGKGLCELLNMRYDDLTKTDDGKYYVHLLTDIVNLVGRDLEISKELYGLLDETYWMQTYKNTTGTVNTVLPGEFIFRKNRGKSSLDVRLASNKINTLFSNVYKEALENDTLTYTSIVESGVMYYTNEMLDDKRVITKEIANQIVDRFGLYKLNLGGKLYPSYIRFKDMFNDDFFSSKYGDFTYEF